MFPAPVTAGRRYYVSAIFYVSASLIRAKVFGQDNSEEPLCERAFSGRMLKIYPHDMKKTLI
jgi:hypothetical protein